LKKSSLNYGPNGKSKGSGEVIFFNRADALAAMREYSGMKLDGRELQLEIIATSNVGLAPLPIQARLSGRGGPKAPQRMPVGRGIGGRVARPWVTRVVAREVRVVETLAVVEVVAEPVVAAEAVRNEWTFSNPRNRRRQRKRRRSRESQRRRLRRSNRSRRKHWTPASMHTKLKLWNRKHMLFGLHFIHEYFD
jgi:RNA recognition motif-containing protein